MRMPFVTWVVSILIATLLLGVAFVVRQRGTLRKIGFPYQRAKTLFSLAERSFLGALDQAVGPEHRVFGKVRVADIASVKSGLSNSIRQSALNRVAQKHFDFIVCRASDLFVLCAVELNDKSHRSQRAKTRDTLMSNVCRAIDLPLLTVTARQTYSIHDLREQFLAAAAQASANAEPKPS